MNRVKKSVIIFFISSILVCQIACGQEKHVHTWSEAACTEASVCLECGATEGEPLGHTTEFGRCTRCEEFQGKDIVEEIDQKISDAREQYDKCFDLININDNFEENYNESLVFSNEAYSLLEDAYQLCGDCEELNELKTEIKKTLEDMDEIVFNIDKPLFPDNIGTDSNIYTYQVNSLIARTQFWSLDARSFALEIKIVSLSE